MKHNKASQHPNPKPARALPSAAAEASQEFVPLPDEVARRAYFSYLNQGSLPGRDVRHWLEAEAHLLAEWKLTRAHGFHHGNIERQAHVTKY